MKKSYPGINPAIEDWKGQEITDFQEDLRIRVNATISEKWFYTHIKSTNDSIPRIDMLNILSKYAGYSNWDDLVFKNGVATVAPGLETTVPEPVALPKANLNANTYFIIVPAIVAVVIALFFGLFTLFNTREYTFTFIDADTREPIINPQTEVILLSEGESPVHSLTGKDGCFRLKTSAGKIRMVVKIPYYQQDTITRFVKKLNTSETVTLKADDYALMIHYLSNTKVDDWEKRRERLNAMIGDNAMITEVIDAKGSQGMMIYTRDEFIDLLTMPSGTLKNIEVMDSRQRDGKICMLRFRISGKKR